MRTDIKSTKGLLELRRYVSQEDIRSTTYWAGNKFKFHSSDLWLNDNVGCFQGEIYNKQTKCHGYYQTSSYDAWIKLFSPVWVHTPTHMLYSPSADQFLNIQRKQNFSIHYEVIFFKLTILFDFSLFSWNCHAHNAPLRRVKELGKRGRGHGGSPMLADKQCCFGEPEN